MPTAPEPLVPPELLAPPEVRSRGFVAEDAALVLDHWLRRLAAQDARCRTVFGRLAGAFLRGRGVVRLGFARLDDWARERLGLSGREVQSVACVIGRLARLPQLALAFDAGALSWAQVRLLAAVATPDTEADWLDRARGRTTRALEALIREAGGKADTDEPEEPALHFRHRCSRRVRRLWQATVVLARQVAGAELTQAQAAEVIAAEGLSARPDCGEAWPVFARAPAPPDADEARADLEWDALREAIPEDVEALAADVEHVDPFTLEARMQVVVRTMQQVDWQMGRLLRVFLDRRLHRVFGYPSAARYLRERLGLSARKVRALVVLERRCWEAPALGDAYRAGTISAVRALIVLPVTRESTAAAWLARATAVTVRRLADEVEWALAAGEDAPPPADAPLVLTERQMRARPAWEVQDTEVAFTAPASVIALLRSAIAAFAAPADSLAGGFERLLHHVRATWQALPSHRDPVFARDGWRCAVPACTSRRALHDHHLHFRSRGGTNARDNRVAVCATHHLRGIHAGYVRAWGEAPDAITWELGVRAARPPLLRLVGDAYAA
jgi:hypothetical protein